MGLSLEVGILADLIAHDEEGAEHYREQFAAINQLLAAQGLAPHHEPEICPVWSCDMGGYSPLHCLRRLAAHLEIYDAFPAPGDENASQDETLNLYFDQYLDAPRANGASDSVTGEYRHFDHLIVHSDAEGFYLPRDLPGVLAPEDDSSLIAGGMIGSAARLMAECRQLAMILQIPAGLRHEDERVQRAEAAQGKTAESAPLWERFGVETGACLRLLAATEHSLRHRAALVFC